MPISHSTRFTFALAVSLLVVAVAPAAAQGQPNEKLDSVLQSRARQLTGRSRVIVEFTGGADVRVITGQRGVAGRALDSGAQVAELDNRTLSALAANPGVHRVMIDRPAFATLERTGAAIGSTLARQQFSLTGKGVGVAVIDSGIAAWHPDLASGRGRSRVVYFRDFTKPSNPRVWTSEQPSDDYGHGTHVAGIIAGSGAESDGRRAGIAPGVNLIGLKVLDGDGHGYISDVIAAIDHAIALRKTYNIRIINLSVGSGVFESYRLDPLTLACKRAVDAGIVVVTAAGNLGLSESGVVQFGGVTSPGNAPWVLTVGASSHQGTARRSDDIIGGFSSRGPTWIDFGAKPDLLAPGVGIESLSDPGGTLYSQLSDYLLDGTHPSRFKPYLSLSGTSMAAPVVAATVALLLEANPSLTPNAVKAILQYTAQLHESDPLLAQGAGMLNAHGAIRLARFFANPRKGFPRAGDTIEDEWIPWSRHILWGNYRIRGGVPLPGSNAWAVSVTWGALKTPWQADVVWGAQRADNIVWSTRGESGNIVWSTHARDNGNIVWSTFDDRDNIVWSTVDGRDNIVWSTAGAMDTNIVWSTADDRENGNIVWSTLDDRDNIVWSTVDRENGNIVWSTATVQNIVWGMDCGGANCQHVIWGATRGGKVWGTVSGFDNIVWSTWLDAFDNIVWSTWSDAFDNIVWSTAVDRDNIVWSTWSDYYDNIVWSTWADAFDNIVWSTWTDAFDNIVWSTRAPDKVVWNRPASR